MAGVPSTRGFVDSGASMRTRYAMYGALIGASIPVVGTLVRIWDAQGEITMQAVRLAQRDPVLWLLDLMPAFATVLGLVVGVLRDRLSLSAATVAAAQQDLRVATRALEESAQQAKKTQRAVTRARDDLDRFAQVASHDLRAPLDAINSLAEWVREDLGRHLTPDGHQHLNLLQKRAHTMASLLSSLQAYTVAGRENDEIEKVDLKLLAHQVLRQVPGGNRFIMSFDGDEQALHTSRTSLCTVLYVLLDNCVRHHDMPPGRIFIVKKDLGTFVEVVVADDGPGIPSPHHDKVFGLFVTFKGAVGADENLGAGLAVARRVVETLGGEIAVLPQDGRGTRIRFTWPKEHTAESSSVEALARLSLKALATKKEGPSSQR